MMMTESRASCTPHSLRYWSFAQHNTYLSTRCSLMYTSTLASVPRIHAKSFMQSAFIFLNADHACNLKKCPGGMDAGTWGTGSKCPLYSKYMAKCPFSCNLVVALLENFPEEHASDPLVDLYLGTVVILTILNMQNALSFHFVFYPSEKMLNLTSGNPDKLPLNQCAPYFHNDSYVPA